MVAVLQVVEATPLVEGEGEAALETRVPHQVPLTLVGQARVGGVADVDTYRSAPRVDPYRVCNFMHRGFFLT